MVAIIKDPLFWHALAQCAPSTLFNLNIKLCSRMKRHLEPLAIAANITQSSFCRLDQVLLTFSFLVMHYRKMTDPEDKEGCAAIMDSIENRWQKADQELFVAAVILNPFFRTTTFAPLPILNNAGIHSLLHSLWTRFYSTTPPDEFHMQVTDYLNGTGFFQNLQMQCGIIQVTVDRAVSLVFYFIFFTLDANCYFCRMRVQIHYRSTPTSVFLGVIHLHSYFLLIVFSQFVPTQPHAKDFSVFLAPLSQNSKTGLA